jgi:hypothetical protein
MADDERDQEPEQTERLPRTGLHVPVPKRKDVMDAIRKVSEPDEDEPSHPEQGSARPE